MANFGASFWLVILCPPISLWVSISLAQLMVAERGLYSGTPIVIIATDRLGGRASVPDFCGNIIALYGLFGMRCVPFVC